MTLLRSRVLVLLALLLSCSCTLHSTATDWSGLVGSNGYPIFVKSSTNIGINLGVVIPVLGHTTMISMVGEVAEEIADEHGNRVRVIESSVENYWYGVPPLTWFLTPVLTTVTMEYEPGIEELNKLLEDEGDLPPQRVKALRSALDALRKSEKAGDGSTKAGDGATKAGDGATKAGDGATKAGDGTTKRGDQ